MAAPTAWRPTSKRARPAGAIPMMARSREISPAQKAAYHDVAGAGKRKVKRPFFGLNEDDATDIELRIAASIDEAIR